MTPTDRDRLRRWVGLPDGYTGFDPVATEGDCAMVEDRLLYEGVSIAIRAYAEPPSGARSIYQVTLKPFAFDKSESSILVEALSRREAIVLAALGVCP